MLRAFLSKLKEKGRGGGEGRGFTLMVFPTP